MERDGKWILEVSVDEITPRVLSDVDDEELRSLNRRLHQLWGSFSRRGILTPARKELLVNRAILVRREMKKRGFEIHIANGLDEEAAKLDPGLFESSPSYDLAAVGSLAASLHGTVLIPCFAAASGSLLDGTGEDVTFHLRTSQRDVSSELKLFRAVNAALDRFPEFDRNPDFAIDGKVPVWDLALRPCEPEVRVVNESELGVGEKSGENNALKGIGRLPDLVLVPDYVSVSGSFLYHADGQKPGDIDIVYKSDHRDEVLEAELSEQITGAVPDLEPHFVWEPRGANWSHVPLFDLVAQRSPVEPQDLEQESIQLGRKFVPMKSAAGYRAAEFTNIEELWNTWARGFVDREIPIAVEEKYDGVRMILVKDGDKVEIRTEDKWLDRSEVLVDLAAELRKLSVDSVVLDSEVVWWKGGKPLPRREMAAMSVGKEPIKGEDIRANVFDALFLDGKPLDGEEWHTRQDALKRIIRKDGRHLRLVENRIAGNRSQLLDAVKWASGKPGSEGAMLKAVSGPLSTYDTTGKRTQGWAKFKVAPEVSVRIIGRWRKAGSWRNKGIKEPSEPVSGREAVTAYKRLQQAERTWIYRVAVLEDGKLLPVDKEQALTPSDLELRWVVKGKKDPLTGQVASKSEWRGTESSAIWEMGSGFKNRTAGEYAFGNTYASALTPTPEIGQVISVQPVLFREWRGKDGATRYSWTFPAVKNLEPAKDEPDTVEVLKRIVGLERAEKAQQGAEEPTRQERTDKLERVSGDWAVVEQPSDKSFDFVYQHHERGVWTPALLKGLKAEVTEALAIENERAATTAARKIWNREGFRIPTKSIDEIRKDAQLAHDTEKGKPQAVTKAVDASMPKRFPGLAEFRKAWSEGRVYGRGNVHGDLRMESPEGGSLIGWTLNTPGPLAQSAKTGDTTPLLRDKFLDPEEPDDGLENTLTEKKPPQPLAWLDIVNARNPEMWVEPEGVGATKETGGRFVLKASGKVVYGTQKTDFHELFIARDGKNPERWGIQIVGGRAEYQKAPAEQFWLTNRPKDQRPYVTTHDWKREQTKARRERVDVAWNISALDSLKKLGYFNDKELARSLSEWSDLPADERTPPENLWTNRPQRQPRTTPTKTPD